MLQISLKFAGFPSLLKSSVMSGVIMLDRYFLKKMFGFVFQGFKLNTMLVLLQLVFELLDYAWINIG